MNRPYIRFKPQRGTPNTARTVDEEMPLPTMVVTTTNGAQTATVEDQPAVLVKERPPVTAKGPPQITVVLTLSEAEAPEATVRHSAVQRLLTLLLTGAIHEGCEFVGGDDFPLEQLDYVRLDLFPTALGLLRNPPKEEA
jgi:hypothetical protein